MKRILILVIITFLTNNIFGQNLDTIQAKFAKKVCNCIGETKDYAELKPKIDKCYDDTFNFIFNDATPEEIKFYTGEGNLQKVGKKLEFYLKSDCQNVKKVIEAYIKPKNIKGSYPTNLDENKLKNKGKEIESLNGKTVAFDAEIIKINNTRKDKVFLKVKLSNGEILWVGDMTNSDLNLVGNKRRFLGYFTMTKNKTEEQTELGYYILSFASYDKQTNKLNMFPGSERQIYEWANGKVPQSKE